MKKISLILICLTFMSCQTVRSQIDLTPKLSNEEYEVINDLFGDEKIGVILYSETDFSKTWSYLMHPRHLEALYGPPCIDGKNYRVEKYIFNR